MLIDLLNWYNSVWIATPSDTSRPIFIYGFLALLAMMLTSLLAERGVEKYSRYLSICYFSGKIIFCDLISASVQFWQKAGGSTLLAQNMYALFSVLNILCIYLLYKHHLRRCKYYSDVFFSVSVAMLITAIAHAMLWLKLVVFKSYYEHQWMYVLYTFIINVCNLSVIVPLILNMFVKLNHSRKI